MNYTRQQLFCNACGKEMFCVPFNAMGGKFLGYRVCSSKCVREMRWRETLSIMGKEYYTDPEPYKET